MRRFRTTPRTGENRPRFRPHTHARDGAPKVRFETQEEARQAARELRDADLYNGMAFSRWPTPYLCSDPECGGWHVGNWSDEAMREASRG